MATSDERGSAAGGMLLAMMGGLRVAATADHPDLSDARFMIYPARTAPRWQDRPIRHQDLPGSRSISTHVRMGLWQLHK